MHSSSSLLFALAGAVAADHVIVPWTAKPWLNNHINIGTILRRQDNGSSDGFTLEAANNMTGGGYYAEFEVGTPPQRMGFLLDTGSSDTWVNAADSDLCRSSFLQSKNGFCMASFDEEESSTFAVVDESGFDITYLDGRNIQGDYFNDTVTIDGKKIENQQLGLAQKSVRPSGIMGLGFGANVATKKKYPTIIENMVDQGLIDTPAYSLYLNSLDSDSGNILFGAIDQQKFIGDLSVMPLHGDKLSGSKNGDVAHFNVKLNGFKVNTPSGSDSINLPALKSEAILDSGSTISLMPSSQVKEIHKRFDVVAVPGILAPFVDCKYRDDDGKGYTFDFKFDGKTIRVPMREMVVNSFDGMQDQLKNDVFVQQYMGDWGDICIFGIADTADFGFSGDDFTLLGDTFLRSAYVVYDLANEQLGLAQANLGSRDSDIVEITKGDKLPSVKGVEGQDFGDEDAAGVLNNPFRSLTTIVSFMGVMGAVMLSV